MTVRTMNEKIISDRDFGQIVLRTGRSRKSVRMEVRPDELFVSYPAGVEVGRVLSIVESHRARLLAKLADMSRPGVLGPGVSLDFPLFHLDIEARAGCEGLVLTGRGRKLYGPSDVDYRSRPVQVAMNRAIELAMKYQARQVLPGRLRKLAGEHGLTFGRVSITGAVRRWGSCSSAGNISLSCHLVMLPEYLVDYVMLHELAHTKEMNHGPRFQALLDSLCEGRSRQLREELGKYRIGDYSRGVVDGNGRQP